MEQHIKELKKRIHELKGLINEHAKVLNSSKGRYSPYFDQEIEHLRLRRLNTLQRTRMEPEDL